MEGDGLEGPPPADGAAKYDELLAPPGGPDAAAGGGAPLPRAAAAYEPLGARFVLRGARDYERQYSQLYFYRLAAMRGAVAAAAAARWPRARLVRVLDVPEDPAADEVVLVGTLYKNMRLKPSILDEYAKGDKGVAAALAPAAGFARLTAGDDSLVLEDEGARVALRCAPGGPLQPGRAATGVVAAVRGRVTESGEFEVADACFAGFPPQAPRPALPGDAYVCLVSGLGFGSDAGGGDAAAAARLSLLADWLCGGAGGAGEAAAAARVARVVVAGGLLSGAAGNAAAAARGGAAPIVAPRGAAAAAAPLRSADMALTELAAAAPVDVMPGPGDPANAALPQQPVHACLLPGAAGFPALVRATNPHDFSLGGVRLLGTGGQNVDDLRRYTDLAPLDALAATLEWRHLAPTAPDTLAAYPYFDADPFIVEACPHVLFAGGQPAFESRLAAGPAGQAVRLVCVPDFAATGVAVLVNLRTLGVRPVHFEAQAE